MRILFIFLVIVMVVDAGTQYAHDVVGGKVLSCKWVRLACERHIRDLERSDIWFDAAGAQEFFAYCECLKHYKGPQKGKGIVLEPWQKFIFANIYGWKRVIDGVKTDIWRYRYVYIEVPRKNGKTTIAACGATYDCAFIENTGAEVYCLATKEEQARLLWNDCRAFINRSEDLQDEFKEVGKHLFASDSSRTSFIKALGRDSDTLDGLNPFSVYADELHAWVNRDLWDVMEDAFGARDNWHMITITTAGYNRDGICYQERKHLTEILLGHIVKDDKFGVIYTVDDDEIEDWESQISWERANPNLGHGKQLDYMQSKAEKAAQIPSQLGTFLNKQLNVWTDAAEIWLNGDQWNRCGRDYLDLDLKDKKCYAAFDLARVRDLSAVAYLFPVQPGVPRVRVLVDFYVPEEDMRIRSKRDHVQYDLWVNHEWIKATPGNTTDFDFIRADILRRCAEFDILEVAYDRHFAGEIVNSLQKEGVELVEFGMGFISMGAPTAELERLVVSGELEHNNNPVLSWNSRNTVVDRDPADNMKPNKKKSEEKIDGIVAVIMALGLLMAKDKTESPNPYETRGLRTL